MNTNALIHRILILLIHFKISSANNELKKHNLTIYRFNTNRIVLRFAALKIVNYLQATTRHHYKPSVLFWSHIFFFFAQSRIYPFHALLLLFPLNDNLVLFSFLLLRKFGVEYVLHFSIYRVLIHFVSFRENFIHNKSYKS